MLYVVGAWFGATAVSWTERQVGELPAMYRWFERGMTRAGWAFVLLMPGQQPRVPDGRPPADARPGRSSRSSSVGIALKLVVLWIGGKIFEDQIRSLLDWIEEYQW